MKSFFFSFFSAHRLLPRLFVFVLINIHVNSSPVYLLLTFPPLVSSCPALLLLLRAIPGNTILKKSSLTDADMYTVYSKAKRIINNFFNYFTNRTSEELLPAFYLSLFSPMCPTRSESPFHSAESYENQLYISCTFYV